MLEMCRTPCAPGSTIPKGCVPHYTHGQLEPQCNCQCTVRRWNESYGRQAGFYCESQSGFLDKLEIQMMLEPSGKTDKKYAKMIGLRKHEFVFECGKDYYEFQFVRDFLKQEKTLWSNNYFVCPDARRTLPMVARCANWKVGDGETVCKSKQCKHVEDMDYRKPRAPITRDQMRFQEIYRHFYEKTDDCSKLMEAVVIEVPDGSGNKNKKLEYFGNKSSDASSCQDLVSDADNVGYRMGCRLNKATKSECFSDHSGQRCTSCKFMNRMSSDGKGSLISLLENRYYKLI
jgi:hypothetical protein